MSEDEDAGSVRTSVAGWVVVVVLNHICMVSIPSLWPSSLWTFVRLFETGVYGHTPHCRWALTPFCASWFVSSASDDFAQNVFVLNGRIEDFVLAAFVAHFLTGKTCSSLFPLLLKTALSLALVRFLIHSIHSGTFLFQESCKDIVLTKISSPLKSKCAHVHNVWFACKTSFITHKSRRRRA